MSQRDVEVLRKHVLATIGGSPDIWPGGYPDQIEAALLDAVFSVQARYGNREKKTGVYGAVWRWHEHRGNKANDLEVLARTDPAELRTIVANNGKVRG